MIADAFGVASILLCLAPVARSRFVVKFATDFWRGLGVVTFPIFVVWGLASPPTRKKASSGAEAYYLDKSGKSGSF